MYVSIDWLKNCLPISTILEYEKIKNKNLLFNYSEFPINKLTLSGFEIEEISIKKENTISNIVFEIETTPNRLDITNTFGFNNEILSLMNLKLKQSQIYPKINKIIEYPNFSKIKKSNLKKSINLAYFAKISNLNLFKSPIWLKKRLLNSKINPINNILDLLNYSILEFGQPIQVYDLNKIQKIVNNTNIKINFRNAKENENFIGVNNISYVLNQSQIVITANDYVISLAGIIQQKDVAIDDNTTNILLECLNLNKKKIKTSNKILKFKSQSSILFEKGIFLNSTNLAFQRTLKLIELLTDNKIKISTLVISQNKIDKEKYIEINILNIKKLLGKTINQNFITNLEILSCLKKLNFEIIEIKQEKILIKVPHLKLIKTELEIIDEIIRIYNLQNIKSIIPNSIKLGKITKEEKLNVLAKKNLINNGFNEVVSYSLNSKEEKQNIELINPLSQEYSNLRTTLLNNLINILIENRNQRNKYFSCFEIGRVFNNKLKQEYNFLSALFGGEEYKINWNNEFKHLTWYEAKEIVEKLLQFLKISVEWNKISHDVSSKYHPTRTAIISYKDYEVGIFSQIHPMYAKQKNISDSLFMFEINLTRISQLQNKNEKKYEIFSIYPKIRKDISFEIDKTISANKILKVIKNYIKELELKDIEINVEIFDNFKNIKNTQKNILGFKLEYQSRKKTLINNEIELINENIIKDIEAYLKVQ
jgi:phenylalanyl-tRNA synthetase beta chain